MKLPVNPTGMMIRFYDRFSVRTQFLLIYGVLMVTLTLSMCMVVYSEFKSSSSHQADSIGQLLSEQTASAATDMLVTGDRLSLNILLKQLVQNPYVAEANIYSIDNRNIARATSQEASASDSKVYSAPINYQDVIAGYVRLYLNEELLSQKPTDSLMVIVAISFLLLFTGLLLTYFYADVISSKLKLIERQLVSILPGSTNSDSINELSRVSQFVESQLTEKRAEPEEEAPPTPETSAILAVRAKNIGRLQQLLAPQDLQEILGTFSSVIERAVKFYDGELTYTPEGNAYIRFDSDASNEFGLEALSCALMIEDLMNFSGENSIASIHTGIGLSFSDEVAEFPEEFHPSLNDSAATQALQLAAVSEPDGLHMFKAHLSWLPNDLPDLKVSEFNADVVRIDGLTGDQADELKRNITEMLTDF